MQDWHPIKSAPYDRDLELAVIEDDEVYALVFPCRRKDGGYWTHGAAGRIVPVDPTHWRGWRG